MYYRCFFYDMFWPCEVIIVSQIIYVFKMRWIFSIYLILSAALVPGVYSASNRNEYQKQKIMFPGSRVRPVRKADNFAAICEPIA
jgi:hypothetical protein